MLFDVDRFKAFNDLHGHLAGDLCLKRIGEAAAAVINEREAVLARYGGEEFLLLAPRLSLDEALAVAERLRAKILHLDIPGDDGRVSASFGVAAVDIPVESFTALTAAADIALYAYTHLAHQCDYDLTAFPAIRAWLARVETEPGHIAMEPEPAMAEM